MDTLVAPIKSFDIREPIPGYHLLDRIGAGGYGEVWLADAPGGMKKAVKIVHGPLGAQRADRELKSLERIKQVQHPMLLSLERFEVVDDHIVIVTELASGSLKDRFDEYLASGRRGIPRAELLAYLRDVADGLDYLFDEHNLQHLDVKPENLLLIADRVKVADFGLVKELGDSNASLVGGLTPLYAPPEIFDGKPNQFTDQYSLAIVYQELLTGEPPFAGRTVAQLAAQHLHSNPCLTPLPKLDQPIIARALSKDPARRFSSCRKLIDSLNDAHRTLHRSTRSASSSRTFQTSPQPDNTKTVVLGDCSPVSFPIAPELRMLGPVDVATKQTTLRPTIFIGVGGLAGRVLRQLRQRMCERFGNIDDVPAFQMLCLDTDGQLLSETTLGERTTALRGNQLVPIPLRQPNDYRNDSKALLEWLNRRWLYNIPRSRLTEGIRALGRLAFVDHYAKISEALHHAINSATAPEALDESARKTGINFDQQAPRVFVIGSSSGGTSSGCILDLGYAVRSILGELRHSSDQVCGVLAHATPRQAKGRDLAIANTVCLLDEYRRFASHEGYPGEPACGLAEQTGNTPPFEHTYFVSCNEDASLDAAPIETHLAEYIYQASTNTTADALQQVRTSTGDESLASTSLRTFGTHRIGGTHREFIESESDVICRQLISQWAGAAGPLGDDREHRIDPGIEDLATKFSRGSDLRVDRILAWGNDIVSRELVEDPRHYFLRKIADMRDELGPNPGQPADSQLGQVCKRLDALLFGASDEDACLQRRVAVRLRAAANMKAETLRDWFFILVDARRTRVQGARDAVQWFSDHLEDMEQQLQTLLTGSESDSDLSITSDDEESLLRYAMCRLRQLTMRAVGDAIRIMQAETIRSGDRIYEFSTRLRQLDNEFAKSETPAEELVPALAEVAQYLVQRRRELTSQLDQQLAPALVNKEITLSTLLNAGSDVWLRLVSTMRSTATTLVAGVVTKQQVAAVFRSQDADGQSVSPTRCVKAAMPELLDCGASARLLVVAPHNSSDWPVEWVKPFEAVAGAKATRVLDADQSLTICFEAADVPLANVVAKLIGPRTDFYKVSSRLHTRIDVDWSPLDVWISSQAE